MKKKIHIGCDDRPSETTDMVESILTNLKVPYEILEETEEDVTIEYTPPKPTHTHSERVEKMIYTKWEGSGFLAGLEDDMTRPMAEVFTEVSQYLLLHTSDEDRASWSHIIFPTVRRVFTAIAKSGDTSNFDMNVFIQEYSKRHEELDKKLKKDPPTSYYAIDLEAEKCAIISDELIKFFLDGVPEE